MAAHTATAQMELTFQNLEGVTTKTFTDGTTLVELPLGTNLSQPLSALGVAATVDGNAVALTDIVPNPATTHVADDETVAFYYKGRAYQFRFSEGKYFTAVFISDPHTAQSGHDGTSVADMQAYVARLVAMGADDAPRYEFSALPGYVPTCDIALSLGDMDQDSEKSGDNFKTAHAGFADAGIPFITMCGNHDIVPDYWTGSNPDKGLTWGINDGGSYCNDIARRIVEEACATAQSHGISGYQQFADGSSHTQVKPFTFVFNGVRFYCGQTYWFQKPYDKPSLTSAAKYYAPDGMIAALEKFVSSHTTEPSIWMQHYPFVAGSDCDRWWLDQNDVGLYIKTSNSSAYGTDIDLGPYNIDATAQSYAKKKKDKLADIILRTKNAVHFSGHVHSYAENTYNGLRDYTVAATGRNDGGMAGAFLVLCKGNKGVVEVKRIHVSETNNAAYATSDAQLFAPGATNAGGATLAQLTTAMESLNATANDAAITAALAQARAATTAESVAAATTALNDAFAAYHAAQGAGTVDATALLGANTDFESTQGTELTTNINVHPQPGWAARMTSYTNDTNAQYIHLRQRTDDGAPTATSLYLRAKWQAYTCMDQVVKQTALPVGKYTLTFRIKKAGTLTEDLCYYELGGQRTTIDATTSWQQKQLTINVSTPSLFTLSFGFTGGVGTTESAVSVDDITLICTETRSPYAIALEAAKATAHDAATAAVTQFGWTDAELATKSAEQVGTAIAVLNNAVAIANAGGDATALITNADFGGQVASMAVQGSGGNVNYPSGWTFERSLGGWNDCFVQDRVFNAWAGTINRAELSQNVAMLPNGVYRFSADVKTDNDADPAATAIALYGNPGWPMIARSEEVGGTDFHRYACAFDVVANNATIGIRSDRAYYQIRNIKLEWVGATAPAETAAGYLRQDYYWDGREALWFDATQEKYAQARNTVVHPTAPNQIIKAAAANQFAGIDKNIVVDGACDNLVVTDGHPMEIREPFAAATARYARTMTNNWGTVLLPFALTSNADVQFYALRSVDADNMTFTQVADVAANCPATFKRLSNADVVTIEETNVNVAATTTPQTDNTGATGWTMQGAYTQQTMEDFDGIYYIASSQFWAADNTVTLNPFRAIFRNSSSSVKTFNIATDTADNINQTTSGVAESALYDISGRHVATPRSGGLYIRDGKKVIAQ